MATCHPSLKHRSINLLLQLEASDLGMLGGEREKRLPTLHPLDQWAKLRSLYITTLFSNHLGFWKQRDFQWREEGRDYTLPPSFTG